ncbi:MAG: HEAT repeat domain-containing protein [Streptosporangiaceae bacterium]
MSDDPDPSFLFFYEDAEEKRQRIEGAQPPASSVRVPRILAPDDVEADALEYRLLQFPWEPWSQGTNTQALARQYADWLNEVGTERLAEFRTLLLQAGAPVPVHPEQPCDLASLGAWIQHWFALVGEPYVTQGFIERQPSSRLGWAWAGMHPGSQRYSRSLDAVVGSLAHDLALMVAETARTERPDIAWQLAYDAYYNRFVVTIDPELPTFDVIAVIVEFLLQSVARPRGSTGRKLRNWFSYSLERCAARAAHGTPIASVHEMFPDARATLTYRRLDIGDHQSQAPAPASLIAGVELFRQAGWFDSSRLRSADVASAALAAWRLYEHEEIPEDPGEMYWRLLLLDGGRTWSEDVDADVQEGEGLYAAVLESLTGMALKPFGSFWDADEQWGDAGNVTLYFLSRSGKRSISVPSARPYLNAGLFAGLNKLLAEDGPRMWFFDHGPPIGIVTRATHAERDALERLAGITLDRDPPAWWSALAPVPNYPSLADSDRIAVKPAKSSRKTEPSRATASGARGHAPRRPQPKSAALTAHQVFTQMMRDSIAPALRELGFKGSVSRGFTYLSGDYSGGLWTQKSRHSTKEEVYFWVHLGAFHEPSGSGYWNTALHALIPQNDSFSQWTIRADRSAEPVAQDLLEIIRNYGWLAIQAAVDSPGYPPDPEATWARTFPPPEGLAAQGPDLGPLTWLVHRATHRDQDLFADLADTNEAVRMSAAVDIGCEALDDKRAIPALLNRLEFDPSALVRERAALSLGCVPDRPEILAAFRAAAAQDEDLDVRWAARYGLRLAAMKSR